MDDLLAELRRLAERFPIPDGSWHGHVSEMREVAADLAAAVAALERLPEAVNELGRRIDAGACPVDGGGPELKAAAARVRALPLPAATRSARSMIPLREPVAVGETQREQMLGLDDRDCDPADVGPASHAARVAALGVLKRSAGAVSARCAPAAAPRRCRA